MDDPLIIDHINKMEFFESLTSEEKSEIISFTTNFVSYREGDVIVQQESNDPSLYILIDGKVELRKNEEKDVVISTLLSGSIFGTIPSLPVTQRNKNALSVTKTIVLRVDRPMLDELNPVIINKFNMEFIKILFRRIAEMNTKVARERGGIARITSAYETIKVELDGIPSLSEEARITSNFMYQQLKNIHKTDQ